MGGSLRAKLQFNDLSHPKQGFGSRYHGHIAKNGRYPLMEHHRHFNKTFSWLPPVPQ